MNGRVHLSTACLLVLGAVDLVVSLMWLSVGHGEGNPLFRALARHGSMAFALGKLALLLGPVLLLEYARRSHPKSAEQGTWIAFCAYFLLFALHLRRMVG